MAKSTENAELEFLDSGRAAQAVLDEPISTAEQREAQPSARPTAPTVQPQPVQAQVRVDESKAGASYANFCRITGTPEELIIDFGLNSQPMASTTEAIAVTQRVIVNFYTAKRMLAALQMSLQRHEAAFGVLETDVQRRVLTSARRQ